MKCEDPSNWVSLGPRQYRLSHLYTSHTGSFSSLFSCSSVISVAREGGPIALVPNGGWGIESGLRILTAAGKVLCGTQRETVGGTLFPIGRIVGLGWVDQVGGSDGIAEEGVACVYEDGGVRICNARGVLKGEIKVQMDIGDSGSKRQASGDMFRTLKRSNEIETPSFVQAATVLSGGAVVALLSDGRLSMTTRDNETVLLTTLPSAAVRVSQASVRVGSTSLDARDSAVSLIALDPNVHNVSVPEILVCNGAKSLITLVNSRGTVTYAQAEPFTLSELSPCGEKLAVHFSLSNTIGVLSSENGAQLYKLAIPSESTHNRAEPLALAWIGSECVVAVYPPSLVLLDVTGDGITAEFSGFIEPEALSVLLTSDKDALRVITGQNLYMLDVVSPSLCAALQKKSSPAYKLHKACSLRPNPSALTTEAVALSKYRTVQTLCLEGELCAAARDCVMAAYSTNCVKTQKSLLRSASYGYAAQRAIAGAIPEREQDEVALAIANLRIENSVRSKSVGIALTHKGFKRTTYERIMKRLSSTGAHSAALSLGEFVGLDITEAAFAWAMDVVREQRISNQEVIRKLTAIMDNFSCPSGLFGRVAAAIARVGMKYLDRETTGLVRALVQKETYARERVSAWVFLGQWEYAMIDALESGDPEVVVSVVREVTARTDFVTLVRSLPSVVGTRVVDIQASYLKGMGKYEELRKLYADVGRWREAAGVDILVACKTSDVETRRRKLEAAKNMPRGKIRRSCLFELSAIRSAISVTSAVEEVGRQLSVADFNSELTANQLLAAAAAIPEVAVRKEMLRKLRQDLKIPDRRYCWVVLRAMAARKDVEGIERLAEGADDRGKIPVVGHGAFVEVCLSVGMINQAAMYAGRIADLRDRARALARCGRGREAAEIAARLRNQNLMQEIAALAARAAPALPVPVV